MQCNLFGTYQWILGNAVNKNTKLISGLDSRVFLTANMRSKFQLFLLHLKFILLGWDQGESTTNLENFYYGKQPIFGSTVLLGSKHCKCRLVRFPISCDNNSMYLLKVLAQ